MTTPCALVLLADGFEEIEAMTAIDVLRRAGIKVTTASLKAGPVEASRQTRHLADVTMDAVAHQTFDLLYLPGGQPGVNHLCADGRVIKCVQNHSQAGKWVSAICAAPLVLKTAGLIQGKSLTCYPSVETELSGAHHSLAHVVIDGKIVTSRGPATTMELSIKLVELLCGEAKAQEVAQAILYVKH